MTVTKEKVIKIDAVVKYISEDLDKVVKITTLDFEDNKVKVISDIDVNPIVAKYDEEEGLMVLDESGNDILNEKVYCILFSEDFTNTEMTEISLEGAKNGVLVLMHLEPLDEKGYDELLSNSI